MHSTCSQERMMGSDALTVMGMLMAKRGVDARYRSRSMKPELMR